MINLLQLKERFNFLEQFKRQFLRYGAGAGLMVSQDPYNHYVTTSSLKNQYNRHLQEPSVRIAKPVVLVMIVMVVMVYCSFTYGTTCL